MINQKPLDSERRPWGTFEIIAKGKGFWLKRFSVTYRKRSSKQFHQHRNELWIILEGKIQLEFGNDKFVLGAEDIVLIPVRAIHRMKGLSKKPARFLELATGRCDETDIVRLEDDYGREG